MLNGIIFPTWNNISVKSPQAGPVRAASTPVPQAAPRPAGMIEAKGTVLSNRDREWDTHAPNSLDTSLATNKCMWSLRSLGKHNGLGTTGQSEVPKEDYLVGSAKHKVAYCYNLQSSTANHHLRNTSSEFDNIIRSSSSLSSYVWMHTMILILCGK